MNDIQIKGSEDYGKLCCFRDDEGNEVYGHLSLFMKAISNNPNERDMYFRQEDGKAYRLAWKVDEEDVLSPDEEVIHEQNKMIERLQEQLKEANEVIRYYDIKEPKYVVDGVLMGKDPAHIYCVKWGLK